MEQIDMDSYRIQLIDDEGIELERQEIPLRPMEDLGTKLAKKEKEVLSKIIESVNDRFGTEFTAGDKVIAQQLQARIEANPSLVTSAKVNSKAKVKLTFKHLFDEKLQEIIDEHFDFYKKVNDNSKVRQALLAGMFEMIYRKLAKA